MLVLDEQRARQIPDGFVRRIEMPLAEAKEWLLYREDVLDQLRAGEGVPRADGSPRNRFESRKRRRSSASASPAEPLGRRRGGQIQRAEQIPRHVRPAKLAVRGNVLHLRRQPIAAEHAGERLAQHGRQDVRPSKRRNPIPHERLRDEGPQPAFVPIGPMAGFVGIERGFVRQRRLECLIRQGDGRTGLFTPPAYGPD